MISRHWTGFAKPEQADNYVAHLTTETFPQLSKIDGFISASILRRTLDDGVEFLIVTNWESIDAIRNFAGDAPDSAVVPTVVQGMMIQYDSRVRHYEVAAGYNSQWQSVR